MAVRVCDRGESRVAYVEKVRQLNKKIAQTVANGPRKYMPTYGDRLVCAALDAYRHVVAANGIYLAKGDGLEQSYRLRREHLLQARADVDAVGAMADVYFSVMRDSDAFGPKSYPKAFKRMQALGELVGDARKLIGGVLKSDRERYVGYNA